MSRIIKVVPNDNPNIGKLSNTVQKGYWNNISNQRSFLDDLVKRLNIKGMQNITAKILQENKGSGLLDKYNCSLSKLLQTVYPEYPFITCSIRSSFRIYPWTDSKVRIMHVPHKYEVLVNHINLVDIGNQ